MHEGKRLTVLYLSIVSAFFIYGIIHLLTLRFEKGDASPPYSSYRPDPMGTKVFYEALRLLPEVETRRNVEPLQEASGLSEASLFFFGLQGTRFSAIPVPQESVKALDRAALEGGRVVVSFFPASAQPVTGSEGKVKKAPEVEENPDKQEGEEQDREHEAKRSPKEYVDLSRQWGVETDFLTEKNEEARLSGPEKDLPPSLPWRSALYFVPRDSAWRTLYATAGKPVLIERSYGKGSLVLSSDSFFLSNEAMKKKRYPQLLSWLCGTRRKIVFDETHLGLSRSPGIATLLRKYGLAPFFISLIGLALLTVWKQAARLVPADGEEEKTSVDPGKDAVAGFTNLLRRNISSDRVLDACLEEWKRSFTHGRQDFSALLPRIEAILAEDRAKPKRKRDAVRAYREVSGLGERR